jgi:hypothetical protein
MAAADAAAFATVGLEWVSLQVLQRTNASPSRKLKIDYKVSADQRGHGLGVSLEVYSRSDLEEMLEAVIKAGMRGSPVMSTRVSEGKRKPHRSVLKSPRLAYWSSRNNA